jgi:hypothetical protein
MSLGRRRVGRIVMIMVATHLPGIKRAPRIRLMITRKVSRAVVVRWADRSASIDEGDKPAGASRYRGAPA